MKEYFVCHSREHGNPFSILVREVEIMKTYHITIILMGIFFVMITGCSNSSGVVNPVIPDDTGETQALDTPVAEEIPIIAETEMKTHDLLGTWIMTYDPETNKVSVEPDRSSMAHFNIRTLIPPPGIMINSWDPVEEILDVGVIIQNPFPISGYDVRVIIYTDTVGHMLTNEDNWTKLYDIPGGLDMNPFKAYAKSEPDRLFAGQTQHKEDLLIKMPGGNFIVNFAIDASYPSNCVEPYWITNMIQEEILYDRLEARAAVHLSAYEWEDDDIVVTLTCPEVFGTHVITMYTIDNENFYADAVNYETAPEGEYDVIIEANADSPISLYSIDKLYVTEKEIVGWAMKFEDDDSTGGIETDTYGNVLIGLNPSRSLISFTKEMEEYWTRHLYDLGNLSVFHDIDYEPTADFAYATAYAYYCGTGLPYSGMNVIRASKSERGNFSMEYTCYTAAVGPKAVTGDPYGSIYNVGNATSGGDITPVMWKVNSDLDTQFNNIFHQGEGNLQFNDLIFSDMNTIVGMGEFWGTSADIDPGDNVVPIIPSGYRDGFIAEFTSGGTYQKVRIWGGYVDNDAEVHPHVMKKYGGSDIMIAGDFQGTVDFDPALFSYELYNSVGTDWDLFVSRFNSTLSHVSGFHLTSDQYIEAGGIAFDIYDNIYLCGNFKGTADFDPGSGETLRTSIGPEDMFLAKYTPAYDLVWVRTWGNEHWTNADDVAYDTIYNQVYLTGRFLGTLDFDPGEEVFEITGDSGDVPFLMRLTPNGLWEY